MLSKISFVNMKFACLFNFWTFLYCGMSALISTYPVVEGELVLDILLTIIQVYRVLRPGGIFITREHDACAALVPMLDTSKSG